MTKNNDNKFKRLLISKGFTQKALADACGCTSQTINNIVNKYTYGSIKNITKISKALGITTSEVIEFIRTE